MKPSLPLLALALLALALLTGPAAAQDKPLVIPQVEGAKQGRVIGRAIACGAPKERVDAVLRARRERMLASVGRAFTEDRYAYELDRTIGFETSLGRPSDEACAKALDAFARFESGE